MVTNGTGPNDHWIVGIIAEVPWIILALGAISLLLLCLLVILRLLRRRVMLRDNYVVLELTPPPASNKTPLATTQFLGVLHQLALPHSLLERLRHQNATLSLEVVSSRSRGIRYMLYVPQAEAANIQRNIAAYLPDVSVKKAKDYLNMAPTGSTIRAVEFRQTGHPSLPLQSQESLSQHDPIAYMTGAMTQLKASEQIVFQLLLSPLASGYARQLGRSRTALTTRHRGWLSNMMHLVFQAFFRLTRVVRAIVLDGLTPEQRLSSRAHLPPSAVSEALLLARKDKLSQPLFQTNVRALVVATDTKRAAERIRALESSLATFDTSNQQSLRVKHRWLQPIGNRFVQPAIVKRLPTVLPGSTAILAAGEIAGLYHFPYSSTAQADNLIKSLSRTLPAPISLKGSAKCDVLLGNNYHHGLKTPIGLTAQERERHLYIVGGTGNGKTTLLLYAIVQDIRHGKGLAVIDPHGDLAESILRYIPKKRLADVVYFNPDDVTYPVGLNILELPPDLTGNELVREKDLITETVISVFRKIFSSDDEGGHRIEYVLRNTIQTALTVPDATIFTVFRLLTNGQYRRQIVARLEDQDLQDFWNNEIGKAGDYQRIKMSAGITAKIGRFLFSGSAKRVLGQPQSTIDFNDIINSGKILICNFSKGLLGEDTASLFGITVLAKLQIATLRRARLQPTERRPFYLYVDEFQNFATMSFVQMMSEARKYKLFLNMAEQSTAQQHDIRITNIILANVGTVICFRSASPADEQLLLPVFAPFIEAGELAYLPPFHFYIRIAASKAQEPFSGETIVLSDVGSALSVQRVIESSRLHYTFHEAADRRTAGSIPDIDDYEIDSPLALS